MKVYQHAKRILAAWSLADAESFERELEAALSSCRGNSSSSAMELEQRELLESVVERFHLARSAARPNADLKSMKNVSVQCLNASFALLQHLSEHAGASISPVLAQSAERNLNSCENPIIFPALNAE